ncbi:hypothetical protein AGMMS50256_35970 [Betaproteobacteria bacterium]|nr:hypothetical protein AGMMS50256_35970 [Betaproteobacteria bacterium]
MTDSSPKQNDETVKLQEHIVSPADSTERLQAIQHLVAGHTGEAVPDFVDNVLRAIPIQAGGLFPITDVWYIEPGLDTLERLRLHIAQFAREIAGEAQLADSIEAVDTGIGFICTAAPQASLPNFGHAIAALLYALSHDDDVSGDFQLIHELGPLLRGRFDQASGEAPRLSDDGLVKLFRLLRLARRLLELESGSDESGH